MIFGRRFRPGARVHSGFVFAGVLAASFALNMSPGAVAQPAAVQAAKDEKAGKIELAPHRAVYDLKLATSRGKRPVESVHGRILYDFTGNECEGYALQFRHVSELDSGESNNLFTDLRATTWEDAASKSFRFNSQNYINEKLIDSVDGQADREGAGVRIKLKKPANKTVTKSIALAFPTEHMKRVIAAAREGKTVLELSIFDGSETGEKTYDTLAVIGQPIRPDAAKPEDAAGREAALANLTRWPVRISYFDKAKTGGEQMPVYGIGFELYENGISRGLLLDYSDFVIGGEMTSLEIKKPTPCK